MDALTRLPVECLEHVLQYIDSFDKGESLFSFAALCRTNRHIATVVFPYLYRDPFRLLKWMWKSSDDVRRQYRVQALLRTLLVLCNSNNGSDSNPLHPALVLELGLDTSASSSNNNNTYNIESTTSHRRLDLLKHVRHIHLEESTLMQGYTSWNPQKVDYVHSRSFSDECQSKNLTTVLNTSCHRHNDPAASILLFYPIVVDREAIWALSAPIFSQLESVTIPYSDIQRYVEPVVCLEKLERIHVILDLQFDDCYHCGYGQLGGGSDGLTKSKKIYLIRMVKEHTVNFPGRLKNVTRSLTNRDRRHTKIIPALFNDLELFRMLPPPSGTRRILFENWSQISCVLRRQI